MSRVGSRPPTRDASKRSSAKAIYPTGKGAALRKLQAATQALALYHRHAAPLAALQEAIGTTNNPQVETNAPRDREDGGSERVAELLVQLEDSGVEDALRGACHALLSSSDLPYNLYAALLPWAARQAYRPCQSRYEQLSDEEILRRLKAPLEASGRAWVMKLRGAPVWGLQRVAHWVHGTACWQLSRLVCALTPPEHTLEILQDYTVQTVASLVGPAAFLGTLFPNLDLLQVRTEYFIAGYEVQLAMEMYANSILQDMQHMHRQGLHCIMGLRIGGQFVTLDALQDRTEELRNLIIEITTDNCQVFLECCFCLDESLETYQGGEKQYGFHFLQLASDTGQGLRIMSFTEMPMSTLHEGFFASLSDAEAYTSAFAKPLASMREVRGQHDSPIDEEQSSSSNGVRLHGFGLGSEDYSPYAWQITAPIRTYHQKLVASSFLERDLMDLVRSLLVLLAIDKESYGSSVLIEVYRLMRSPAAQMHRIKMLNSMLCGMIKRALTLGLSECAETQSLFMDYRHAVANLMTNKHRQSTSELQVLGEVLEQRLNQLVSSPDGAPGGNLPLATSTVNTLRQIRHYCRPVGLAMSEAAVAACPQILELVQELKALFPEEAARPLTAPPDPHQKKRMAAFSAVEKVAQTHGYENEPVYKHRHYVLNMAQCEAEGAAPKAVATDTVLLKYVVDSHLHEFWSSFLASLLLAAPLPAFPYPQLVTSLRQYAMRQELCSEKSERLSSRLLHGSARPHQGMRYIHHIPGCDVHGLRSALAVLDPAVFFHLTGLVQPFIQTNFLHKKGPYRIALCCAMSGHSPLYGRVCPYLLRLELHEHCYVRGPEGCAQDAIQLYSTIVLEHVQKLLRAGRQPVYGVTFGDSAWLAPSIVAYPQQFRAELQRACLNKELIVLKGFVLDGWRYIAVHKHLLLHFINDEETSFEAFHPVNAGSLYQSVFFEAETAAFHLQYSGVPGGLDPFGMSALRAARQALDEDILRGSRCHRWLQAHRLLLTRSLLGQQPGSAVVEAWRMLHSVAGQLEYLVSVAEALTELCQLVLEESPEGGDTQRGVDEFALTVMAEAFRDKVMEVCSSPTILAATSLPRVFDLDLQTLFVRDDVTQQAQLNITEKVLSDLHVLREGLQSLVDMTAYDIHTISPSAVASLRSIEAELCDPPNPSQNEEWDAEPFHNPMTTVDPLAF